MGSGSWCARGAACAVVFAVCGCSQATVSTRDAGAANDADARDVDTLVVDGSSADDARALDTGNLPDGGDGAAADGASGDGATPGEAGADGSGSCPEPVFPTRQTVVHVHEFLSGPDVTRDGVDGTDQDVVFGFDAMTQTVQPFPQAGNRVFEIFSQPRVYLAMRFTVPTDLSPQAGGSWGLHDTSTSTLPFPDYVAFSVSKCPGDFSALLPVGCRREGPPIQESGVLIWEAPEVSDPYQQACHLERGQTYYLNMMLARLDSPDVSTCADTTCNVGILKN